jgi:hypothetical protein
VSSVEHRFRSPEEAALSGFPNGHVAYVAAIATVGDYAAVVVAETDDRIDDLTIRHRDASGWYERSSTSGRQYWTATDEAGERGLLCFWGIAADGVRSLVLVNGNRTVNIEPEPNGYWVWAQDDLPASAMDTTELRGP